MDIVFSCRTCGAKYKVSETLAGRLAECKKCGQRMSVPYRSPVVKLDDDMMVEEDGGGIPEVSRTFEEYEPLRKQTKNRGPKPVVTPFTPLPSLLTDLWIPLSVAVFGYGISAYLLLSYIFGSNGVAAGLILLSTVALLFWIGVVPMGKRMVEAASDSFGFEGSNFLLLQVVGVLALPVLGVTHGALAGGLSAAIAYGLVGCTFGIALMAVVLQTSAGNGFQTAVLSMLVSCISLGVVVLFVWGVGLFLIPRWGLNLPWQPLVQQDAVAVAPQPAAVSPKLEPTAVPAAITIPAREVVLAPAPVPMSSRVVREVRQPPFSFSLTAAQKCTALSERVRAGLQTAMIRVEATLQTPEFQRSITPLSSLTKLHEWPFTVVSIGQEDTTDLTNALADAKKQCIEAKKLAVNARTEATRMEGARSNNTTTTVDALGHRRLVYLNLYSTNEIGKARAQAIRLESDARIAMTRASTAEKNLLAAKTRRVIEGMSPTGWPVIVTIESAAMAKIVEGMTPSSVWSVRGVAKAGPDALIVKGLSLKTREKPASPVVAASQAEISPRKQVPFFPSASPVASAPRAGVPEKRRVVLFETDDQAFGR